MNNKVDIIDTWEMTITEAGMQRMDREMRRNYLINRVNEIDKSYTLVKVKEKKNVVNWFEKFDLNNV